VSTGHSALVSDNLAAALLLGIPLAGIAFGLVVVGVTRLGWLPGPQPPTAGQAQTPPRSVDTGVTTDGRRHYATQCAGCLADVSVAQCADGLDRYFDEPAWVIAEEPSSRNITPGTDPGLQRARWEEQGRAARNGLLWVFDPSGPGVLRFIPGQRVSSGTTLSLHRCALGNRAPLQPGTRQPDVPWP